jgi:hypothetical protein
VTNFLISPNAGTPALAFDNLTVNTVPESSTLVMLAGAVTLAAARLLKRQRV